MIAHAWRVALATYRSRANGPMAASGPLSSQGRCSRRRQRVRETAEGEEPIDPNSDSDSLAEDNPCMAAQVGYEEDGTVQPIQVKLYGSFSSTRSTFDS